uniref:Bulb-type lectin domain-containing protein n=1 Tax=Lactuca sativa TaxID=4236 RepID=A0A9R1W7F8_LACSA|nr:hypothetical protein LSAT_V11C300118530 [Lactuca sativa]
MFFEWLSKCGVHNLWESKYQEADHHFISSMIVKASDHFFIFFFLYLFSIPSLSSTLVSPAENFELGFFKPGQSPNYYIGIWYKKVQTSTIVWVANRETPISDAFSSKLQIVNGNLVILDESNTQIWSTNITPTPTPTTSALSVVLLDDGNLVLRYNSSSTSSSITPIWQSFDHPTNTFLPGGKFGYNKRTNTKQIITSWKSTEDPSMGPFSLEFDQDEKQYVIKWNRSVEYWTSGSWNGRIFSAVPEMRLNYIYNFSYVDNENESYFTYSLYDPSIISRLVMDVSGQIQQQIYSESLEQWNLFWTQPRSQCQVYAFCGPFGTCSQTELPFCSCLTAFVPKSLNDWNLSDFSGECVRRTESNCGIKEEKPGFIEGYVPVSYLSTFLETETPESKLHESACRRSCLDDCSCDAYSFILKICRLWNSENLNNVSLLFVSDDANSRTFPLNIKVSSSDLPNNAGKTSTKVLVAGIVSGFCGLVFLCSIGIIFYRRVKRQGKCFACFLFNSKGIWCSLFNIVYVAKSGSREENRENFELEFQDNGRNVRYLVDPGILSAEERKGIDVPFIEFKTILSATDNFSLANKLGQGGFGPVYKVTTRSLY